MYIDVCIRRYFSIFVKFPTGINIYLEYPFVFKINTNIK